MYLGKHLKTTIVETQGTLEDTQVTLTQKYRGTPGEPCEKNLLTEKPQVNELGLVSPWETLLN